LLCSPIPSSRFSIAQIRTCRHTLGRTGCVVVVGVPQCAYALKLQESYQTLFDITWPSSSSSALGLFICLPWQRTVPIGQSFFPSVRTSLQTVNQGGSLLWLVVPACVGCSCSLDCFNLEGKAAKDAHAGSVPGVQVIELASRNGSGRDVGWLDTKVCHRS
jgi:hypothetical protein